jgi:hypothetical protein
MAGKTPEIGAASSRPSMYRKPQTDSTNIEYDQPSQDIDHTLVRDTGIALSDARGIEMDVPLASLKEHLATEKFWQEPIEVLLADPGSEDEHQFVEITVNGERVCGRRGEPMRMKRCHLAVLAGAKTQAVVQKKVTHQDGSTGYEERFVLRPLYPFQVTSDANPVGQKWLRQLLQNAA